MTDLTRTDTRSGQAQQITRWIAAFLLPFLVTAAALLYIWPDRTEELFAWTINPPMTALLMGAGFLSGAYFFTRVYQSTRWSSVSSGFLPIAAFAWIMGITTFIHWDRFNHDHISFIAWISLYILTPFLVPALWLYNRSTRSDEDLEDSRVIPAPVRYALAAIGILITIVGVLMFLYPDRFIPLWPWTVTPLTARILGGWFVLSGLSDFSIAQARKWRHARIVLESQAIGLIFILLGAVRALENFDPANPLTAVFLSGMTALLVGTATLYIMMERQPDESRRKG